MSDRVMLYKHPGKRKIHGDMFDYIIVERSEVKAHLDAGWSLTTAEAKAKEALIEEMPAIPPSKLTEAQKSNIRIAEGTQKEIAKKFNVTTFTVSRIKNGKIK